MNFSKDDKRHGGDCGSQSRVSVSVRLRDVVGKSSGGV
jgi:hypothetical protein